MLGLNRPLCLSVLAAALSVGQQPRPGVIAGTVTDPNGFALPGASIAMTGADVIQRRTDADGRGNYRVDALTPGVYRVQIELPGFVTSIADAVAVESGKTAWHDVELKLAPNAVVIPENFAPVTGSIAGRVTDTSGGVLPGVTVTLTGPKADKVVTSARGEYEVDGLGPGLYQLTFALTGFRPGSASLTVTAGRRTRSHVALRIGLFFIVDYVMPPGGAAGALREADVVAHIRLNRAVGVRLVNDAMIVTDHDATVVSVVKTDHPSIVPGASIRIAQDNAGAWTDGDYRARAGEMPYTAGQSFLAFLSRNKDSSLSEYRGQSFMWPVKQGFVVPVYPMGALPSGPMRIDDCLAALRKLLAGGKRLSS